MKTTVHVIPHAHWDREWYMPLEIHRARLVTQLDNVLELLEKETGYTYHLDGQMIALEDYLIFRPENEEKIKKYVSEGRLHIGPWYVLQDEFLTSGEANVRNLLYGMSMAEKFGKVCRIGYLPDAFGNVSQMPQLFRQSGMMAAAFGRGVSLRPDAPAPDEHFPAFSEFYWGSPDGSKIPAIFFSGWYNNAQEIPEDPEKAKPYWDERLAHAKQFAISDHLLFLNGADHQPVQKNLGAALNTARKLYPDIEFRCSDFEHYTESVFECPKDKFEIVTGELAGQESNGSNTLCNTASARAPIKQMNRRNETLLSMNAEPMLSMAALTGMKPDNIFLHRAWKLLMENHPHDSICGCGIDEVHRETVYRYEKSIQLGNLLVKRSGQFLAEQIQAPGLPNSVNAFAVFNPTAWPRSQVITAEIGVDRAYGTREARKKLLEKRLNSYHLCDRDGKEIPAEISDEKICFGYELPDDSFRKPYFERRISVTFCAENIPAFGWTVYYLKYGSSRRSVTSNLEVSSCRMENRWIAVDIHKNGTFDITEKKSGKTYSGLGIYEDVGDVGNEYIFSQTLGAPITSERCDAEIDCVEKNAYRCVFKICQTMYLPVCAENDLNEARESMQRPLERKIERSKVNVALPITTFLALEKDDPVLKVKTEFNNTIKDHRLRMLFPTDMNTDRHLADSVFDVIERPDRPGPNWSNPSSCQRMQFFAAVQDDQKGLAVINKGEYEYEILPERNQIAVTLLRSVGELGDWGVFPTPDAQCQGPVSFDLGIYPYEACDFRDSGYREASQFQTDLLVFPVESGNGTLPDHGYFLSSDGKGISVTALKPAEDEKGIILRAVNLSESSTVWRINIPFGYSCFMSDILEKKGCLLVPDPDGFVSIPVKSKEITTIRIEKH